MRNDFQIFFVPISDPRLVLGLPVYKGSVTGAPFPNPPLQVTGARTTPVPCKPFSNLRLPHCRRRGTTKSHSKVSQHSAFGTVGHCTPDHLTRTELHADLKGSKGLVRLKARRCSGAHASARHQKPHVNAQSANAETAARPHHMEATQPKTVRRCDPKSPRRKTPMP